MTEKKRANYHVSAESFVKVWQLSASSEDVAKRLKLPRAAVASRASGYRQRGVKLKKMPRRGRRLDVERLNKLIERLGKRTDPPLLDKHKELFPNAT